jgi:hypothetical protein
MSNTEVSYIKLDLPMSNTEVSYTTGLAYE